MPRELVHWRVLSEAARDLPVGRLQAALKSHGSAARLGAMAPDAFYYYRLGGSRFETIAEQIHGAAGQDTLEPVRTMLRSVDGSDVALCFTVGFLSHLATDIVFHPFVYAMTGDYYDADATARKNARTLHRLLETHFEQFLRIGGIASFELEHPTLLSSYYKLGTVGISEVLATLEKALPAEGAWKAALFHMAGLQRLFINPIASRFAHNLNRLVQNRLRDKTVLFLPIEPEPFGASQMIRFKHPVTGADLSGSFSSLLADAEMKLKGWLNAIHSDLEKGSTANFDALVGESLNTGTLRGKNSDMVHFRQTSLWNAHNDGVL